MLRRHRRGPEQSVRDTLWLCCVDPSRVGRDVYQAHVDLAKELGDSALAVTHSAAA